MSLNVLCRLYTQGRSDGFNLRGSYAENLTHSATKGVQYWGAFRILDVQKLEWVTRRRRGSTTPDCELLIDNTDNHFLNQIGSKIWAFAFVDVWVGRGQDFDAGYAKKADATSGGMLWSGRLFYESGLVRQEDETVLLRASNNPFLFDPGVLLNSRNAFVEDEDGFDRWIPLVLGDWTTNDVRAADSVPCIRTASGNGGGTWTVGLGPLDTIDSLHKVGPDPANRDNADSFDSVDLTAYATDNEAAGTTQLNRRVNGAQLTYTPQGLWARVKGLKTTATQSIFTLANDELIDFARDQMMFLLQRRTNSFGAPIDVASVRALPTYKGRRVYFNQRSVQEAVEEIEHDLAFRMVNLSGYRGTGSLTTQQVAVKLGQGRILSDWSAERFLVPRSLRGQRDRQVGYRNVDLGLYNWIASSEGRSSAKGYHFDLAAAELVRFGFIVVGLHQFRWLYNQADVQAIQDIYLAHFGEWPLEAVVFNTTLDYLDILPTDRLVLEPDQDTNAQGTRYLHVEEVALDWEHQLLRVSGYKGARQSA